MLLLKTFNANKEHANEQEHTPTANILAQKVV